MLFKRDKGDIEPRRKLTKREVATRIWNDRTGYLMCLP